MIRIYNYRKGTVFFLHFCRSFCVLLFCLLSTSLIAETQETEQPISKQTYKIPAGPLLGALNLFARQSDIDLIYDPVLLEGIKTQGLDGDFDVPSGLSFLLIGSGLQFVAQPNGYEIIAAQSSGGLEISGSQSDEKITVLPTIEISAGNTANYAVASSVTATKTNTLLRDVPQSITVITEELIQDQAVQSIGDAVRYVPGVGVSQGEGNRDALIFRGNRTTGDFFVDGVRDDVAFFRDLYNIERIEVLKGANGMIFGRGGSGGVVNRVTKKADWNPIRELSFQFGSFSQKRARVDVGHVLNDKVAFRLNGLFEDSAGFRDGFNMQRWGVTPTVTIKPTKRSKIILSMERFHDDRTADRGIPSFNGRPVNVRRSQVFGDPNQSRSDADVLSFNSLIEYRFDFGLTLRNRTNYANYDKFYQNIFAASEVLSSNEVFLRAYNDTTDRENVFNQTDFLYSMDTGPVSHTLLAGIEVGRQTTSNVRRSGFFGVEDGFNPNLVSSSSLSARVPLSNPITSELVKFKTRNRDADNHTTVDVTALYIQDQIELLPQLHAIAGLRYDIFEVNFRERNDIMSQIKTTDHLFSPRFGLIYKPIEPLSFYVSYSRAFVPRAGDQLTGIVVTRATLKPEKFTTYEAGIKWDIFPDLALTGAVYRLDRTNVITPTSNVGGSVFLSGKQRTEGIEIGLSGRLTKNLSVVGGYAYQEGEILSTTVDAEEGATLGELPRNTFSMWGRYDFTPRYGAALGVIYRGPMFAAVDNTVRIPGFTRVDAAVYAQFTPRIRGQINVENLFNAHYFASVHNNNNISPGAPTTIRATLTANF